MTTPRIKSAPTTPPATPPASAPEFELLPGVEVGDRSSDVLIAVSVCDICVTWIVNVGAVEPVPVTSGLSRQDECLCVSRAQGTPIAPPLDVAASWFQWPSNCKGTVDETFWESKCRVEGRFPHLRRYRPTGVLACHLGPARGSWSRWLSI